LEESIKDTKVIGCAAAAIRWRLFFLMVLICKQI